MATVADSNQFDALATPTTNEQKSWEATGRGLKDDAKEQAYQAKNQLKGKAVNLQEQVVAGVNKGVQLAKEKAAQLSGNAKLADASNEELLSTAQDTAAEGWEEVKRRGNKAVEKGARQLDAKIDENLTPAQKAKLNKGVRDVKQAGVRAQRKAEGLFGSLLSGPQLRPIRSFIEKNNLQLPVMILGAILSLWLSLSLIRLITTAAAPPTPEFDIHSMEASKSWLKWHAGEYKNQAVDLKDSLSSRAASFLANHDLDSIRSSAVDWRDIGMKRLGLAEPTWGEWVMHYVTGRPITWQGRVLSVLDLAKSGLKASALGGAAKGARNLINDKLGLREPTLLERATNWITGRDTSLAARAEAEARLQAASLSGRVGAQADSLKANLAEGVASIKAHIPGTAEAKAAAELAAAKAYAATHHSTLDNIASGAEYIKNRIVHGAEEAKHIAQDKANRVMDEAKLKTGL